MCLFCSRPEARTAEMELWSLCSGFLSFFSTQTTWMSITSQNLFKWTWLKLDAWWVSHLEWPTLIQMPETLVSGMNPIKGPWLCSSFPFPGKYSVHRSPVCYLLSSHLWTCNKFFSNLKFIFCSLWISFFKSSRERSQKPLAWNGSGSCWVVQYSVSVLCKELRSLTCS